MVEEEFKEPTLQEALKSGERLCKAANKISPGIIKNINKQKFAAMQRENISNYLIACKYMAFNKATMFETSDLYEGTNLVAVIENIYELAKRALRKGGLPTVKEIEGKRGGYDVSAVGAPASNSAQGHSEVTSADYVSICPDCGSQRDGDTLFCADCGHQFQN